jgi:hypothetical protein
MTNKKDIRVIGYCLILILFSLITYNIDARLVVQDRKPLFVIPTDVALDGGTTIYIGLGYKVIGWKQLATWEVNNEELTGYMTGYEISSIFNSQDIDDGPKKELKFIIDKE